MSLVLLLYLVALCWVAFIVMLVWGASTEAGARIMRGRLRALAEVTEAEIAAAKIEEEEEKPFLERLLMPVLKRLGDFMSKNEKLFSSGQLAELLDSAGHPMGMQVHELVGLKLLCLLTMGVFALFFAPALYVGMDRLAAIPDFAATAKLKPILPLFLIVLSLASFAIPDFILRHICRARQRAIRKSMPDVVDLITLGLEAGLGFDGSVGQTIDKVKSPLTEELARCMREVSAGKARADAFRDMAARVKMPELSLLVTAIDQAEKMGIGLATAMRAQSEELRERRRTWAAEQAAKLPVKMLIPLILFIFPALFIVILGPACVQFAQMAREGTLF